MTVQVKGFQTPKNGSTSQECQDAVAWDENRNIFAIADGVSDSAFQSLWANLLVNGFVARAQSEQSFTKDWLVAWLEAEQREWHSQVNWNDIPWHGRLKAQQIGGQATFLGIRLIPEKRSWVGIVMGDCNLFRFGKDHTFKESIPNKRSADFSNATQAFSSISQNPDHMLSQTKMIRGVYEPGDYLVLATDAMACWMLEKIETKGDPLNEIPPSDESSTFNRWVNAQRQNGKIKDDDTSILMIQPEPVQIAVGTRERQPVTPTMPGGRIKLAPPPVVPRATPAPTRPQRASRAWAYVYLSGLLLCIVAGFLLGSIWQNLRTTNRIEEGVQKPLLILIRSLESNQRPSVEQIGNGLLEIIITAQPRTTTGRDAQGELCKRYPTNPGCATPTPQPSKQPAP